MNGWPSEKMPQERYFYSHTTEEYFVSYEDKRESNSIIELPKEIWEQRKAAQNQNKLDVFRSKYILAQKEYSAAKEKRDNAKDALFEAVFGDDTLAPGTHTIVREIIMPTTGEVLKVEFKASVSTKVDVDHDALMLLKPSIPVADFEKIFTPSSKVVKKTYDALPKESKRFLASAVTVKNNAPTFSMKVIEE